MFKWLKRKLKVKVLKRALKRNAPSRFSYSAETNFYVSVLKNNDTDQEVLLSEIDEKEISGLAWSGDRFESPVAFPIEELDCWSFEVKRFYGYRQIKYTGLGDFLFSELTLLPQRLYLREWISQRLYNYRTRFRQDRIEVLKKLIDMHLAEAKSNNGLLFTSSTKSVVALLGEVYGNRIYGHPNYEEESARFRLILESLSASGELEKTATHQFKLNASAVASISNFELEERRHRDSVKQNRLLFLVTVVMAVAAVVQAISTFNQ
jgi:hypothetical protein